MEREPGKDMTGVRWTSCTPRDTSPTRRARPSQSWSQRKACSDPASCAKSTSESKIETATPCRRGQADAGQRAVEAAAGKANPGWQPGGKAAPGRQTRLSWRREEANRGPIHQCAEQETSREVLAVNFWRYKILSVQKRYNEQRKFVVSMLAPGGIDGILSEKFQTTIQSTERDVWRDLQGLRQSPRTLKLLKNITPRLRQGRGRGFESRRPRHLHRTASWESFLVTHGQLWATRTKFHVSLRKTRSGKKE